MTSDSHSPDEIHTRHGELASAKVHACNYSKFELNRLTFHCISSEVFIGLVNSVDECDCNIIDCPRAECAGCEICRATWGWEDGNSMLYEAGWPVRQPERSHKCGSVSRDGWKGHANCSIINPHKSLCKGGQLETYQSGNFWNNANSCVKCFRP